jgi:hypothetical protein
VKRPPLRREPSRELGRMVSDEWIECEIHDGENMSATLAGILPWFDPNRPIADCANAISVRYRHSEWLPTSHRPSLTTFGRSACRSR